MDESFGEHHTLFLLYTPSDGNGHILLYDYTVIYVTYGIAYIT